MHVSLYPVIFAISKTICLFDEYTYIWDYGICNYVNNKIILYILFWNFLFSLRSMSSKDLYLTQSFNIK